MIKTHPIVLTIGRKHVVSKEANSGNEESLSFLAEKFWEESHHEICRSATQVLIWDAEDENLVAVWAPYSGIKML